MTQALIILMKVMDFNGLLKETINKGFEFHASSLYICVYANVNMCAHTQTKYMSTFGFFYNVILMFIQ
jgi:hypothetical protein